MANSRTTRLAAAQTALDVYRVLPGFEKKNEGTALSDLIADLMHLADHKDVSGEYLADKARDTYLDDLEANQPQYVGRHMRVRS